MKNSDGSVTITPFRPPWLIYASAEDMKEITPKVD
jgi:hypothetical protein